MRKQTIPKKKKKRKRHSHYSNSLYSEKPPTGNFIFISIMKFSILVPSTHYSIPGIFRGFGELFMLKCKLQVIGN